MNTGLEALAGRSGTLLAKAASPHLDNCFGNERSEFLKQTRLTPLCKVSYVKLTKEKPMPAKDTFHDTVKHALQKEGWIITHEHLFIRVGTVEMYIDLGAEKIITAEKLGQKIAVEVKSFANPSVLSDFHLALGQFMNYRVALEEQDPERILYLAVPTDTYDTFFTLRFTQLVIQRYQLKLIIYDPDKEQIQQWQP